MHFKFEELLIFQHILWRIFTLLFYDTLVKQNNHIQEDIIQWNMVSKLKKSIDVTLKLTNR